MLEIAHSKLGNLTYEDEGWWKGETLIDGLKIEFFVNGNKNDIDEILGEDCFEVLSNFDELKQKALFFLEKEKSRLHIKQELQFTPTDVWNFFRENNRKGFTMSFSEKSKPEYLWRVEFENSEAKYAGFDS